MPTKRKTKKRTVTWPQGRLDKTIDRCFLRALKASETEAERREARDTRKKVKHLVRLIGAWMSHEARKAGLKVVKTKGAVKVRVPKKRGGRK